MVLTAFNIRIRSKLEQAGCENIQIDYGSHTKISFSKDGREYVIRTHTHNGDVLVRVNRLLKDSVYTICFDRLALQCSDAELSQAVANWVERMEIVFGTT